jgi:hypothetical protein
MALPATLDVSLDFSTGATFGIPLTLDDPVHGLLDTGILSALETPTLIADLTDLTRKISIRQGRNLTRDTYESGFATVRIYDPSGNFNPQNTSSPYYGQLTPLRKLRISADYAGTTYYLFSGYTTDYVYSYDQGENVSYVDINASDAFRLFNLAAITNITGQAAGQDTGTRIDKILDTVDFPSTMRSVSTGDSLTQADAGASRTSLSAIKNCEFSEQGAFYISPEGNAIFKNRSEVISSAGVSPIDFNQTTGIPYKNLKFAFDDKLIVNQANITRLGGTTQVFIDADSVATYFPHSITSSDLVIQTDAEAANVAAIYVATRSDTTIRIDEMTIDLLDTNVPTGTILNMDYFTNVLITNTQPDGSTITKNLQIQAIAWEITPSSWLGVFGTQEPLVDGFILDNTYYGQLNDDILSY